MSSASGGRHGRVSNGPSTAGDHRSFLRLTFIRWVSAAQRLMRVASEPSLDLLCDGPPKIEPLPAPHVALSAAPKGRACVPWSDHADCANAPPRPARPYGAKPTALDNCHPSRPCRPNDQMSTSPFSVKGDYDGRKDRALLPAVRLLLFQAIQPLIGGLHFGHSPKTRDDPRCPPAPRVGPPARHFRPRGRLRSTMWSRATRASSPTYCSSVQIRRFTRAASVP